MAMYRSLCDRLASVPLFLRPEWWDAAAGQGKWDSVCVELGGRVVAAMPYCLSHGKGMTTITQPPLTPYAGWLIDFPDGQKQQSRTGTEHDMVKLLMEQLPKYDRFYLKLYPHHSDLMQWIWAGMTASVRYTYQLNITPELSELSAGLRENLRRALKATEDWTVQEAGSDKAAFLYDIKSEHYKEQKKPMPVDSLTLLRMAQYLQDSGQGTMLTVHDTDGKAVGAMLLVFDGGSCIYLSGATSMEHRTSGASTRLLWESILLAKRRGCTRFDFEGSMIPSIERYFRAFNGDLVPVFELEHKKNPLLQLKGLIRK